MEPLPQQQDCEEDEDEPEAPEIETRVTAQVQVVEANPKQPKVPKLVYMSFKRKEGNAALFGQFVKQIMSDMEKFMEPPAIDEEEESFEDEEKVETDEM